MSPHFQNIPLEFPKGEYHFGWEPVRHKEMKEATYGYFWVMGIGPALPLLPARTNPAWRQRPGD